MSADDQHVIGKTVELIYAVPDSGLRAVGRVFAYSDAPSVGVETESGERIWWRADLARLVEPAAPVTVRRADYDALREAIRRHGEIGVSLLNPARALIENADLGDDQ